MGYVNIPKDLTKVERKVALNLTKRQLCLIIPAIVIGVGIYLLMYKKIGTNAMYLTVITMMPFFIAALYKNRDNEKVEDILLRYLKFKFGCNERTFKSNNIYSWIIRREETVYGSNKTGTATASHTEASSINRKTKGTVYRQ